MGMERSKLVDKSVYIKWYNLAKNEIKNFDLIPDRTKEEIFDLISRENWLLFGLKNENKEIATQKPEPNVFFDVLSKGGNLTGFGRLGLTFNNLGAYNRFKTIMRGINKELKEKITKELLSLKYSWDIKLDRKIKRYNYAQTPEYHEEGKWNSNNINETIIDEIIQKANNIREQGIKHREDIRAKSGNPKKFYIETPTINLMEADFKLNEEEFRDRIVEIFKILSLCLNVKSDVEVNKIIREKIKRLKILKDKEKILIEEIPKKEKLIGITKGFTEENLIKDKAELEGIKREIESLENEIED
ncbi:MAG: hypothetical protein AABX28_01055 [Nanoarchaeota archaeon]